MPGLLDQIEEVSGSGIWVPSAARVINIGGGAVSSMAYTWLRALLADSYQFEYSSVVPGVSATLKVTPSSPLNPYIDLIGKTVSLDNATDHYSILPGLVFRFSNSVGFLSSWSSEVRCGHYLGSMMSFGPSAGIPGIPRKHKVTNTGSDKGSFCRATVRTMAYFTELTGTLFSGLRPFAFEAAEKSDETEVIPYVVTVENVVGSDLMVVLDLRFDGEFVEVKNLTTDAVTQSIGLNVVDWYRVTLGDLKSVEFLLSPSLDVSSEANLLIFSPKFTQVAIGDSSSVPGEFSSDDAWITQDGQAEGEILAGQSGYYWERPLIHDGQNSRSNPHPSNIALIGKALEAAGWTLTA